MAAAPHYLALHPRHQDTTTIGRPISYVTGPYQGRTIRSELQEYQKPDLGRKFAKRDRRPLDPPPVIRLRMWEVFDVGLSTQSERELHADEIEIQGLVAHVDLFPAPNPNQPSSSNPPPSTNPLTTSIFGSSFVHAVQMLDMNGQSVVFFVFSDLSVRLEGFFFLRYRYFDLFSTAESGPENIPCAAELYSGIFTVYSTKEFPGLQGSTPLTKHLSRWGVRVNLREGERRRKPRGKDLDDDNDDDDDEQGDDDGDDGDEGDAEGANGGPSSTRSGKGGGSGGGGAKGRPNGKGAGPGGPGARNNPRGGGGVTLSDPHQPPNHRQRPTSSISGALTSSPTTTAASTAKPDSARRSRPTSSRSIGGTAAPVSSTPSPNGGGSSSTLVRDSSTSTATNVRHRRQDSRADSQGLEEDGQSVSPPVQPLQAPPPGHVHDSAWSSRAQPAPPIGDWMRRPVTGNESGEEPGGPSRKRQRLSGSSYDVASTEPGPPRPSEMYAMGLSVGLNGGPKQPAPYSFYDPNAPPPASTSPSSYGQQQPPQPPPRSRSSSNQQYQSSPTFTVPGPPSSAYHAHAQPPQPQQDPRSYPPPPASHHYHPQHAQSHTLPPPVSASVSSAPYQFRRR